MKSQQEIIASLSVEEQTILQNIMTLEQTTLYINDLEKNKTKEKETVYRVINLIEKVVKNEN